MTGNVSVSNFFAPDLSAAQLGDYKADFQVTDGNITATIDDLSGVLDVSGTITLSPQRNYQVIGEVAARSVGDQDMELFVKGGGRGGGGKISDLFFAVKDDEKEDYEPEDAQRDDEFFVASEFFGRHGF